MKRSEVILGSFYTTKDYGIVRVMADSLVKGHFLAYEQDGQEPVTLPARALLEVAEDDDLNWSFDPAVKEARA